ncbi:tryptophan/tyrosine permease [Fragilaria crotonensis]|nr:tryptophan/tyrosine permease [Fragilaria crotonensis]
MFLDESPLSLDLWLRSMGLSSISSQDAPSASEEIMVPAFDSEQRRGSARFSKAAVILTFIGSNGSLGMPYAFERCGVAVTIILMIALAITTDRTMYLFWMCARKTGANTYGGVVRSSFGHRVHCVSSAFLFVYLLLIVSQSMRSVYTILTTLRHLYFGHEYASDSRLGTNCGRLRAHVPSLAAHDVHRRLQFDCFVCNAPLLQDYKPSLRRTHMTFGLTQ